MGEGRKKGRGKRGRQGRETNRGPNAAHPTGEKQQQGQGKEGRDASDRRSRGTQRDAQAHTRERGGGAATLRQHHFTRQPAPYAVP
eukprot:4139636-Pyramimonas_sp.AAC.1